MKSTPLALLTLVLVAPSYAHANQIIPAGSLIQCTISDPILSSQTTDVGDPVLCAVGYAGYMAQREPVQLPFNSYLVGEFAEYKDPGHFIGKGWMELKFGRMVIEPHTVIPLRARVVGVSGYKVDRYGRILGRGHPVRDTVEWSIPILWPIDLINLPRRGPRPTLRTETRLTLKVMDDFDVPETAPPEESSPGLYRRTPSSYTVPPPPAETTPPPEVAAYAPTMPPPPPMMGYAPMMMPPPPMMGYAPMVMLPPTPMDGYGPMPGYEPMAAPPSGYGMAPRSQYAPSSGVSGPEASSPQTWHGRPAYVSPDSQELVTLVFDDGRPPEQIRNYLLTPDAIYIQGDGYRQVIPVSDLDVAATVDANRRMGVNFRLPNPNPAFPPNLMEREYQ